MKIIKIEPRSYVKPVPKHVSIICDVSGSMYYHIGELVDAVEKIISRLGKDDKVSVAFFSGEGDYGFFIVNTSPKDVSRSDIEKFLRSRGTTCFSGVLSAYKKSIVGDGDNSVMLFLTDGHPVVPNLQAEEGECISILRNIIVAKSVFVGFGMCNVDFLERMADACNGTFVVKEDSERALGFLVETASSHNEVAIVDDAITGFQIENTTVTPINFSGKLARYNPALPLYVMIDDGSQEPVGQPNHIAYCMWSHYGSLTARRFADAHGWTNISKAISCAITPMASALMMNRLAIDALPEYGENSVVDFLNKIVGRRVITSGIGYKRIGVSPTKSDFVKVGDGLISGVVWNEKRMNCSIQVVQEGYVIENGEMVKGSVFRNYTVIKDGHLNVTIIPIRGEVQGFKYVDEARDVHYYSMSAMPFVTHKNITDINVIDAGVLAKRIEELSCELKYYKQFVVKPEKPASKTFAEEKVKSSAPIDYYEADTLEIIPDDIDASVKFDTGKTSQKNRAYEMWHTLDAIAPQEMMSQDSIKRKVDVLSEEITILRSKLALLRWAIQLGYGVAVTGAKIKKDVVRVPYSKE